MPAPVSDAQAARFLTQATFGPTSADIAVVAQQGPARWLTDQFSKPQVLHRVYMDRMAGNLAANGLALSQTQFRETWWAQAVAGDDQLRQRMAFALSQIFVVSFVDNTLSTRPRGVTSYYDMLGAQAFGNYRDLLESVALHPMMGLYLSTLRNQKEDAVTGRSADQNFAREVMQLFTIGLVELNSDGTLKNGRATDTYTPADIEGLAKVFTGWSWYAGPSASDRTDRRFLGNDGHLERDWQPMQAYDKFHSTSEKRFLGTTIAAGSASTTADLKVALDRLFNHPNTGPFFGRQLIQRLVTSNPSPAYVGRVAAAFADNGRGVRGDMKAVIRAVLLDGEARVHVPTSTTFGKPREPLLRLSAFFRAFKATSVSGRFSGVDETDSQGSLSQAALRAPSVFNFYRPNYTPPNSAVAAAGLVAPEWQLANEVTVAAFVNYLRSGWLVANSARDIQPDFSAELALADNPAALVDRLNLLLMSGQMSASQRTQTIAGITGRAIPTGASATQAQIDAARRDRVCIAILLTMASADFMVQK